MQLLKNSIFRISRIILIGVLLLVGSYAAANTATQVFQLSNAILTSQDLQLNWTIADGAYLYQKFIKITPIEPEKIHIASPLFPEGETKNSKLFGKVTIFRNTLSIHVPIENPDHATSTQLLLSYRGCSEQGQCFPPITQILNLDFSSQLVTLDNSQEQSNNIPFPQNETQEIEQKLETHSYFFVIGGFFILGLFLSVTPCVLPMLPILSSIILHGYEQNKRSKTRAFNLSLTYVLGMAIAYAALGFMTSLIGNHLQAYLQNTLVTLIFSCFFVFLALSLLGFFDITWNSSNKIARLNQKLAQAACKNYLTVTFMGFLSALIVSPCVTPPLVAALSYIATKNDLVLGTLALFCMGLGLGFPLLVIGILGKTILPKVGAWMESIKSIMGILLLGIAVLLWSRLIPHYTGALFGLFLITASILLLYRIHLNKPQWRIILQILCFIAILYGGFTVIDNMTHSSQKENFVVTKNKTQLAHLLNLAKTEHKPVILDFYADWCPDCQLMEAHVFNQPEVLTLLRNFVWIKVDMTQDTPGIWALQKKYNISGPPTFLFYAANGTHLKQFDFVGSKSKKDIIKLLEQIQSINSSSKDLD